MRDPEYREERQSGLDASLALRRFMKGGEIETSSHLSMVNNKMRMWYGDQDSTGIRLPLWRKQLVNTPDYYCRYFTVVIVSMP